MSQFDKPVPWVPEPYMQDMREWLAAHPHGALLLEPGMRKTSITLAAFCDAQQAHDALLKAGGASVEERRAKRLRAVVIAPRRVIHRVWPIEAKKWIDFYTLKVAVCHGTLKERTNAAREDADIYCVTNEGFQWLADCGHLDRIGAGYLIIDELSKYKNGSTKRHKHLRKHLAKFTYRVGLTGSFVPRTLLNVWGQVYCIDMGRALGQWFTHFRNDFFVPKGYGGYDWQPKPNSRERILDRLKDTCVSLAAKDYIKLPELSIDDREFELPPPARKIYTEMEGEYFTLVDSGRVTAPNAAVAQMKCRQICSGALYTRGLQEDVTHIHEEKLDILEELLDELQGAPLFVIVEWKWELDAIQKRFGTKQNKVPMISGGTSDKEADRLVESWNRGELPLLCVQSQSISHGVNMQEGGAAHILGLTLPWDWEVLDQIIRRIWRSGNSAKKVFFHRALAANTVEQAVIQSHSFKENTQLDFVSALKLYRKTPEAARDVAHN